MDEGSTTEAVDEQQWPMGAVTRRTGLGEHTLRAWERRFGFPEPRRLPSGHRRYTGDQVQQLLMIAQAHRCGYRAGDIVPLSREKLEALLRETGRAEELIRDPSPEWLKRIIEAGRRFDRDDLARQLQHASLTLGLRDFLRERVGPLVTEVGEAWLRDEIEVRHEHFISAVLEDTLRGLRVPLEQGATGRPVLLACLPEEPHSLGLHIAAAAIAGAGRSLRIIGQHSPVDEIVQAAATVDAVAVGLSVTEFSAGETTVKEVIKLRRLLPSRTRLWLGGSGASQLDRLPSDVQVLDSLDELDRALRDLKD
jgi:DNA-binding transcriptional MerR regulator/methylmalonyl-CoA mutase cobalamin-binding subunit